MGQRCGAAPELSTEEPCNNSPTSQNDFNNTVKRIITKRQTFYISGAISKIAEVILYYSANKHSFKDYPKHYPKVFYKTN